MNKLVLPLDMRVGLVMNVLGYSHAANTDQVVHGIRYLKAELNKVEPHAGKNTPCWGLLGTGGPLYRERDTAAR